jgi:hypothetical protein
MKKLVYHVSGMLLVVGLSAAPSLGATLFSTAMVCDGGGSGSARIDSKGNVRIDMNGLEANTPFTCQVVCNCVGDPSGKVVDQTGGSCTTDAKGRLKVTFEGAAAGFFCTCPAFQLFNDQNCESGFDLSE